MNYEYSKEMDNLLMRNTFLKKNDIYYFDDSPNQVIYNQYFQFCQQNLRSHCANYEIQPSFFYFKEDLNVNAHAIVSESNYIIGINKGTIGKLYELFANSIIFKQKFENYRVFELFLDDSIYQLMFQFSTQFTYYH